MADAGAVHETNIAVSVDAKTWLKTKPAAAYAKCHPKTLITAARRGEVDGYQSAPNACWKFQVGALDAWIKNERPRGRRRGNSRRAR